jgi:hypothetical protein
MDEKEDMHLALHRASPACNEARDLDGVRGDAYIRVLCLSTPSRSRWRKLESQHVRLMVMDEMDHQRDRDSRANHDPQPALNLKTVRIERTFYPDREPRNIWLRRHRSASAARAREPFHPSRLFLPSILASFRISGLRLHLMMHDDIQYLPDFSHGLTVI